MLHRQRARRAATRRFGHRDFLFEKAPPTMAADLIIAFNMTLLRCYARHTLRIPDANAQAMVRFDAQVKYATSLDHREAFPARFRACASTTRTPRYRALRQRYERLFSPRFPRRPTPRHGRSAHIAPTSYHGAAQIARCEDKSAGIATCPMLTKKDAHPARHPTYTLND